MMVRFVAIFVLFVLHTMLVQAGESGKGSKLRPDVERLLRWLPQDTESVIVSQERFEIGLEHRVKDAFQQLPANNYLFLGIRRGFWQDLKSEPVTLAVSGRRRFRSPTDGGPTLYEGCDILQFDDASSDAIKKSFETCLKGADREDELVGNKIAVFKERMRVGNDDWTFFLANPRPTLLLCATDRAYLHRVLARLDGRGSGRALPESLSEWQQVDLRAPVWAVRHYERETSAGDPTSPLGPKTKANVPDANAVGFVFWYDGDPTGTTALSARYLSRAPDALRIVTEGWNREKSDPTPRISQVAPEVVEVSLPKGKEEGLKPSLYVALKYCGNFIFYD